MIQRLASGETLGRNARGRAGCRRRLDAVQQSLGLVAHEKAKIEDNGPAFEEGTDNVSISYFRSSGRYLIQKTIVGMLFGSGVVLALSCQYLIVLSFFSFATSVAVSRTSQSGVFGST